MLGFSSRQSIPVNPIMKIMHPLRDAAAALFVAASAFALFHVDDALSGQTTSTVKSGSNCYSAYTCVNLVAGTTLNQFNIQWQGHSRQVLVVSPTAATSTKAAMLIVLHGTSMTPALMANTMQAAQLAASQGYWVVLPASHGLWNSDPNQSIGNNDVGFLNTLITTMTSKYPVDPKRVSMAGFSRGAYMTELFACLSPQPLASVAVVSGTMTAPDLRNCTPSRPLPILYVLGTADPRVNYNGAYGQDSAPEDFTYWNGMLACGTNSVTRKNLAPTVNDGTSVSLETNLSCTAGGGVELYTVTGGGHAWPGSTVPNPKTLGIASQNLNATTVIGQFAAKWTTASTH